MKETTEIDSDNMNECLLCLECQTISGPKFLKLFSEEGMQLNMCSIINKYFWLKTCRDSGEFQTVCMNCWEVVREFHILYSRVEEVHKNLEVKTIEIDDPLPHSDVVMLKWEEDPVSLLQNPIMDHSCLSDNPFDSEVKVEVNDMDLLTQIEIAPHMSATRSGNRRSCNAQRDKSPKTTQSKFLQKEAIPVIDVVVNDFDVYVTSEASDGDILGADQLNKSYLSSGLIVVDTECNFKKHTKARRGRPRKTVKAATVSPGKRTTKKSKKEPVTIQNENIHVEEYSCSTAFNADDMTCIKAEDQLTDELFVEVDEPVNDPEINTVADITIERATVDEDGTAVVNAIADEDVEDNDNYNDNDYAAESSDDSSNSDFESGDISDWAPGKDSNSDKFAVIVKKKRQTPKKYKKREKSSVVYKRGTKEEVAARKAQKAEYDNIIIKFFEKIRCPICQLQVHAFGDIRPHFRLDHNTDHGYIECCGLRFASRKSLAEHIMVHNNPEHFKCKTCEKICRNSAQLEVHEQTHLENALQCKICLKTLSSKEYLKYHMEVTHMPREEYKFECPECKKKFASKKRLSFHRHFHNPAHVQVCDLCGKVLRTCSMEKHKKVTHGEKANRVPEQCTYCLKWYSTRGTLQSHIRNMHIHADKEHRCEICGFVSSSRNGVRQHKLFKHSQEKRHTCSICDKGFKLPVLLREHMAIHAGIDLYKCDYCTVTFKSKSSRFNHCKRHHPEEYIRKTKARSRPTPIVSEVDNILEVDVID